MINHISLISILLTATFSSTLYSTERGTRRSSGFTSTAEIEFDSTFDLADYTGQTYLSFMTTEVKPAMDTLATDGYVVKGAEAMATAFESVGPKVQGKVARDFGGIENVKKIASKLEGTTVTLATLPGKIKEVDRSASIYDLATFIGLASGGGVKVKYADQNYGLNIHYDVTEQRSGRSYGVGPTRNANDASDKEYLTDLESYVRGSKDNLGEFYTTLFESLLNSDPSNYALVSPEGQTLLTDFLAVFTAEQARNLMDGRIAPHWDAALLEVTLLASFHAGQDKIELFYTNPATRETAFTDKTLKQTPCKAAGESLQAARLSDYWQFSRNITDPSNCRRSGINITKKEFRALGERITAHVKVTNSAAYEAVRSEISAPIGEKNLFQALSNFLISEKSPKKIPAAKVKKITTAWVTLLDITTTDAKKISKKIHTLELN